MRTSLWPPAVPPRSVIISDPLSTWKVSLPASPVKLSSPAPPVITSASSPPTIVSTSPPPEMISAPAPPVKLSWPVPPVSLKAPLLPVAADILMIASTPSLAEREALSALVELFWVEAVASKSTTSVATNEAFAFTTTTSSSPPADPPRSLTVSVPKSTVIMSLPEPPVIISSPAPPVIESASPPPSMVSSPFPLVILSIKLPPVILKLSVWLLRSIVVPLTLLLSVTFSTPTNLFSVVNVCVPDDNCKVSVPTPPSIVSASPSPAFSIIIMSSPAPPVR